MSTSFPGTFEGIKFFRVDAYHEIIFLCDSTMLGSLRMTSKELSSGLLQDPKTFRWIASLRNLPEKLLTSAGEEGTQTVSLAERLRIAETMSKLENNIAFDWGSVNLRRDCFQPLREFGKLLTRHPAITAKIEGHCGIEAPPSRAEPMTVGRTEAVVRALVSLGVEADRLEAIGFGCDRPLTLQVGPSGEKNRRVEIYLTIGGDVEIPKRRDVSEYVKVVRPEITPNQRDIIEEVAMMLNTHPTHIQQYWEHFQHTSLSMPTSAAEFIAEFVVQEDEDEEEDGEAEELVIEDVEGEEEAMAMAMDEEAEHSMLTDNILFMTEEEAEQYERAMISSNSEVDDEENDEEME